MLGLLAKQVHLPGIDFLEQADANLAQLFILRLSPQFFIRDHQVAPEGLDIQVGDFKSQFESIGGRPEGLLQHLPG